MPYLRYFLYWLRHKTWVFFACCKLRIPLRGLVHDLSKLLPSEFGPHARYFCSGNGSRSELNLAWMRHIHRNGHTLQHWALADKEGEVIVFKVPDKHCREMVADWHAKSRGNVRAYFDGFKDRYYIHPESLGLMEGYVERLDGWRPFWHRP